jgi:hypothetical protein
MYFAFNKLYAIICKKKSKKFDYSYDLLGNELSSLSCSCKIQLIENNTLYTFRISDLIKIINQSLSYNYEFHLQPMEIKNPFTNQEFSLSNLYHIYFTIKEGLMKTPILFHYLFLCNFSVQNFCLEYNYEIREYLYNNYMKQLTNDEIHSKILKMMKNTKDFFSNIVIHDEFPKEVLVDAFRKFLDIYIQTIYTSNNEKHLWLKIFFVKKAILFNHNNKAFGRVYTKTENKIEHIDNKFVETKIKKKCTITKFVPFEDLDIKCMSNKSVRNRMNRYNDYDFDNIFTDLHSDNESVFSDDSDLFDDDDELNMELVQEIHGLREIDFIEEHTDPIESIISTTIIAEQNNVPGVVVSGIRENHDPESVAFGSYGIVEESIVSRAIVLNVIDNIIDKIET